MNQQEEEVLERYNDIVDDAIDKAGELLNNKPRIAEIILKQLLRVDSENLSGLQLLGLCKQRLGEYEESIEIIKTVENFAKQNGLTKEIGIVFQGV